LAVIALLGLLASPSASVADELETVRQAIAKLLPDETPDSIKPAPAAGLYEVILGPHVVYVTADGRYLMQGDLLDIDERVNVTEAVRNEARLAALERLGEGSMIVFSPERVAHTVSVFTDVECGYCIKLHREVSELNRRGVKVRYLAFPRAGPDSPAYRKMVSVWCSADARKAITDAKFGLPVAEMSCDNPVLDHYRFGQLVGVSGTPTLMLDDGRIVPGYVPVDRLVYMLEHPES
jgi:thiol:disulfide interchange protein DsbC